MKLLKIAIFLMSITAFSQTSKVGTIDVDFILSKMPELTGVQEQVDAYGKELDADLKKKLDAYTAEINKFKEGQNTMTLNQRRTAQDSIIAMETDINKYQQTANQMLALKREEFLQPLYKKIGDELEKIAQAEGYTQIIQRNGNLIYIDNRFDVTLAVIAALGIELKEGE